MSASANVAGICLLLFIVGYIVIGAHWFRHVEQHPRNNSQLEPNNKNLSLLLEVERNWIIGALWQLRNESADDVMVSDLIENYHNRVVHAVGTYELMQDADIWSWSQALLFSFCSIATIGYAIPLSVDGRLSLIIYVMVGIPLMFIFVLDSAHRLANAIRNAYDNGFCGTIGQNDREQQLYDNELPFDVDNQHRHNNSDTDESDDNYHQDTDDDEHHDENNHYQPNIVTNTWVKSTEAHETLVRLPISLNLTILGVYILLGTFIFCLSLHSDWLTALFYGFITVGTIGIDDIHLLEMVPLVEFIWTVYMLVGIVLVVACMLLIVDEVNAKCGSIAQMVHIDNKFRLNIPGYD